jgi:hypothetical protein
VVWLSNFLHKARYGVLPLKHTRHRLYWAKDTNRSSVARTPPANTWSDRKCLIKWVAQQHQYSDQICHLFMEAKETTQHVLGGECTLHLPHNLDTGQEVRDMIQAHATSNKAYMDHIPLWFPHRGIQDSTLLLPMAAFLSLTSYNKVMGRLGYIPTVLHTALSHTGHKELITSITTHLAKATNNKWLHRCKDMIASNAWTTNEALAERLVSTGIG